MKKKIIALSLAAVAVSALSLSAAILAKQTKQISANAYDGKKTIVLDKDSIVKTDKTDSDTWYFDLEGDNAFGYDEEKFKITGANIYCGIGEKSLGGDHMFKVSDPYYWSFQIPTLNVRGTHAGLTSINLLQEKDGEPGEFDVILSYGPSDASYDAVEDLYDLVIYEDSYILGIDSLTIDRITITYSCAG